MKKLWYNLDRLRTGSLLKDENGVYYVVLGFEQKYIDKNTVMLVISCDKKKPLTLEEVGKNLGGIFKDYIITDYKVFDVINYDYFGEQESRTFLLKYNLLNPEKGYLFQLSAKIVKGDKLKEGKIYQDYLRYFIEIFPFYKLNDKDLINLDTQNSYPYVKRVKDMEFLEVTEQYHKEFMKYYLYV